MAPCFFVAVAVVAQAAATSDTCENGVCASADVSLMQMQVHNKAMVSAYERAAEAIRSAAPDAEAVCVHAEAGEVAPAAGIFSMEGEQDSAVQEGFVAPSYGTFCVPKETMLLIQRAHGFADATAMESALTGKEAQTPSNPWGNDGAFAGKHHRKACKDVPLQCKLSVFPTKDKLCPIGWAMQNQWLSHFPGCGTGSEARRNINAICTRELNLHWACPLTCTHVVDYAKTLDANLQSSYACWATVGSNGQCQSKSLGDAMNARLKNEFEAAKRSMGGFSWIVDANRGPPCSTEGAEELCAPHCSGACSKIFPVAAAKMGVTEKEICKLGADAQSGACSPESVATELNSQANKLLADVRSALNISSGGGQLCTSADVQSVCAAHCR